MRCVRRGTDSFPQPLCTGDEEEAPPTPITADEKYAKRAGQELHAIPSMCDSGTMDPTSADTRTMALLLGAGFLTRFYGLNWPPQVVFDEVHFGKFISGYITGRYFFDIHPPLGKLLIAAVAWWSGYDGTQPFETIGEHYHPHVDIFMLRALPATFGAALPPLMYALARELGCSRTAATLVGGLVLLDGAMLVESRLLLTDSSLFFWDSLQLLTALRASAAPRGTAAFHAQLALTGLAIGAAVSTKWTALANMGVVGLDSIHSLLKTMHASVHRLHDWSPPSSPPPLTSPPQQRVATNSPTATNDPNMATNDLEAHSPEAIRGRRSPELIRDGSGLVAVAWANGRGGGCSRVPEVLHRRVLQATPPRLGALMVALQPVASEFGARFVWLLLLPAAVYLTCMALHIKLLPYVGRGDNFHDRHFRCRLLLLPRAGAGTAAETPSLLAVPPPGCVAVGCDACAEVTPLSLWQAIISLNKLMFTANANIKRSHAFGSGWRMWPLASKPVFYWTLNTPHFSRLRWCRIYMAANPLVWYVGLFLMTSDDL
jgi:hypothetical protein